MLVWLTNNGIWKFKNITVTQGGVLLSQCAAHRDRSSVRQGIVVFDGFDRILCFSPEGGWCPALAVCCPP